MTACSQNETELKTVPQEPVAISFSFTPTQDNQATTRGEAENAQLRSTGFGVFATVEGSEIPNLMYNQQVTYTYLADDAQNGYWSYSPTKYWPIQTVEENGKLKTVPQTVTFCAYAPYVAAGGATGITGMSANSKAPDQENYSLYLDYTLSEELDETVDLLWTCYQPTELGPIEFKMYHALARVAVNVKLKDVLNAEDSYKTSTTKVLISEITLSTAAAVTKGQLKLDNDQTEIIDAVIYHYPTWTVNQEDIAARTVDIYNDIEKNPTSYGIIAEEIRYIEGMPYSWQPDGLQLKYNDESSKWEGVLANALCAADHHQVYVYFIPNEDNGLTLTCTVKYRLMEKNTGYISDELSTTAEPVNIVPLRGNRTYKLKLIIDPKKTTSTP